MKTIIINLAKGILSFIYGVQKLSPVKNRIVFISRQADKPSYDIRALNNALKEKGIETVVLCRKLEGGKTPGPAYGIEMLKQMKYLATSKVAVLDSYCIPASLLKHKEELTIVQMWHALGALKKFSLSILDQPEGHSTALAKSMHMHENYDYVFTSSEAARPAFAEAFGYPPEKLTVMSLPRVDALLNEESDAELRERIVEKYPTLGDKAKKTILYAPTLRKNVDITEAATKLIEVFNFDKFNLIIKLHPVTEGTVSDKRVIVDRHFSTMDMFSACDVVVTDYSAIIYEAALKGIPMVLYDFDHDEYMEGRSFYLDYDDEVPGKICTDAHQVTKVIENEEFDMQRLTAFADKYIEKREHCTEEIVELLMKEVE